MFGIPYVYTQSRILKVGIGVQQPCCYECVSTGWATLPLIPTACMHSSTMALMRASAWFALCTYVCASEHIMAVMTIVKYAEVMYVIVGFFLIPIL